MSKYFSTSGNDHTDKRNTSVPFISLLYTLSCYLKQFQNVKTVAIILENTRWAQSTQTPINRTVSVLFIHET